MQAIHTVYVYRVPGNTDGNTPPMNNTPRPTKAHPGGVFFLRFDRHFITRGTLNTINTPPSNVRLQTYQFPEYHTRYPVDTIHPQLARTGMDTGQRYQP